MGPLKKIKEVDNMCNSCGVVHKINVDGMDYSYVLRKIDPGCKNFWCQARRATIEIAPQRYKNLYSKKDITEDELINFIKIERDKE